MAESRTHKNKIFGNSEALKHVNSPDDLDSYIKLSNPSVWLVLGALLIMLLIGVLWCFTGNILTTITCSGIYNDGAIYAYVPLEQASSLEMGQVTQATIGENTTVGKITALSPYPLNQEQAAQTMGSLELAKSVVPEAGGVQIQVTCEAENENLGTNALSSVQIVLSDIRPIDLMFAK